VVGACILWGSYPARISAQPPAAPNVCVVLSCLSKRMRGYCLKIDRLRLNIYFHKFNDHFHILVDALCLKLKQSREITEKQKITIYCDLTPSSLVRLGANVSVKYASCIFKVEDSLQSARLLYPETGSSMFLRNVDTYPNYTASHPRWQ
jgi:hypothetical protein